MRKADFMVDGIVTVVKTVEWMFSDCCSSAVRSRLYTRVGAPWEIQILFLMKIFVFFSVYRGQQRDDFNLKPNV